MKRLLLVVLPALGLVAAGCGPAPRALWLLNETRGPTAFDSAGNHDGTASNVAFGQPGHEGTSYGFNGVNSVVRVPHAPDLNPGTANFSYGAWVNFTTPPPPQTFDVVRKGVGSSAGGYYKLELYTTSTGVVRARCYFKDSQARSVSESVGSRLNDGQWHHLTCARQGDEFRATADGTTSTETSTLGSIGNGADVTIGAKPNGDDWFVGRIDEVRIAVT
jgi:hypothetical protein